MKLVALFVPAVVTALALSCDPGQPVAPQPTLSLKKIATDASIACVDVAAANHKGNKNAPVALRCAIQAPGTQPLTQGQKGWIDGHHYYLADQSNKGLDVFDADALTFLGRVDGMAGALTAGGGTATTNGPGPSSVVLSDRKTAWVSDGNSTTQIVDVEAMQVIGSVNTSIPACDRGPGLTGHYCGRANEIAYDPEHQLILVQNPTALDTAAPHNQIDTYGTFISARPPYNIVGTISFPNRRGQEAPLWDEETHRIVTAVSGRQVVDSSVSPSVVTALFHQYVAVIDPGVRPFMVEHEFDIDCTLRGITVVVTKSNPTGRIFGINDPALGTDQHMVIPACGRPFIMNAQTGAFINTTITAAGGGNETSYGKGDGNFYVVSAPPAGGAVLLGVIDARSAQLLQTVSDSGGANPAAYAKKNRIFTIVAASTTARTACTAFGYQTSGCITVFGHEGKDDADEPDADDDD
jgi:hypothetical protein